MLFSSLVFLCCFFPLLCICYFCIRNELKNYVLLFFSLCFYAWGEPKYIFLLLAVCIINYIGSLAIDKLPNHTKKRKIILFIFLILNLLFLVYYKYANFLIINLNKFCSEEISLLNVVMPLGISFFTFQSMSYIVDVYRKEVELQKNFFNLVLYISFFPQLIAGPIVKYHDVVNYLQDREDSFNNVIIGLKRFIIGLGKKVIIANTLGEVADNIFLLGSSGINMPIAWLGAICYSFQLYFDFSGYSDMAIGLGRIFGFKFMENFNYPYISKSIGEFWRRWHISLSTWFKDYIYIPLGGSRNGIVRTCINLALVFIITGIWHGANYTFIIWGIWHGFFVILEKIIKFDMWDKKYIIIYHIYTFLVIILGWVIFRADSLIEGVNYIKVMFGLVNNSSLNFTFSYYINGKVLLVLVLSLLGSTPLIKNIIFNNKNIVWFENIYLIIVLFISITYIAASTYNPFIYFRF